MIIFIPFKQLLDLCMVGEAGGNYWRDKVGRALAIAFIEINNAKEARLEFAKQQFTLKFAGCLRNDCMSNGACDGSAESRLISFSFSGSKVSMLVKLSTTIPSALIR